MPGKPPPPSAAQRLAACMGNGDNGRLGIGHLKGALVPTVVPSLIGEAIKSVSAALSHTLFLAEDGTVYAAGSNKYGQLGT
jgi:alpha-tubulin suppressor-like RCC1 family protein